MLFLNRLWLRPVWPILFLFGALGAVAAFAGRLDSELLKKEITIYDAVTIQTKISAFEGPDLDAPSLERLKSEFLSRLLSLADKNITFEALFEAYETNLDAAREKLDLHLAASLGEFAQPADVDFNLSLKQSEIFSLFTKLDDDIERGIGGLYVSYLIQKMDDLVVTLPSSDVLLERLARLGLQKEVFGEIESLLASNGDHTLHGGAILYAFKIAYILYTNSERPKIILPAAFLFFGPRMIRAIFEDDPVIANRAVQAHAALFFDE